MHSLDSITIIVAVVLAGLGLLLGFGRSLRFFTKGIFGVVISVFIVLTFGGMIKKIDAVGNLIAKGDAFFADLKVIGVLFDYIPLVNVIYYVALFFVVQILRWIVIKFVAGIFSMDNKPMRIINRVFGMVGTVAMVALLTMLVFAIFKRFEGTEFITDFLAKIDGSFLHKLYLNNPVVI